MKTKILLLIIALPLLLIAQNKIDPAHQNQALKCSMCHSCEIPTKEKLCLKPCPRDKMVTIEQTPAESPNVITIDHLKNQTDLYKPVKFTHRLHAEMSGFGSGCKMCHHYNPPGKVIGCSDCHEASRKRVDISKPDLKGAYHQQCMNCHRQWSGKVECESCHALNNSKQNITAAKEKSKPENIVHPKIAAPETVKYDTPKASGKIVTFNHIDHTKTFGLDCENCHTDQSCNKCHAKYKQPSLARRTVADKHATCENCHNVKTNCSMCHSNSVKAGFNHVERTGFDILKNHSKLTCNRCHTTKAKFSGLKAECSQCHGTWTKENFKHAVTGLQLDEIHSDLDCTECHQEKNFANPSCKNCHEDKSFPKDKPGKTIKK